LNTLREFCGDRFDHVRDQLLGALADPRHVSRALVCSCVGVSGSS
jgi:hypothetical protein